VAECGRRGWCGGGSRRAEPGSGVGAAPAISHTAIADPRNENHKTAVFSSVSLALRAYNQRVRVRGPSANTKLNVYNSSAIVICVLYFLGVSYAHNKESLAI